MVCMILEGTKGLFVSPIKVACASFRKTELQEDYENFNSGRKTQKSGIAREYVLSLSSTREHIVYILFQVGVGPAYTAWSVSLLLSL